MPDETEEATPQELDAASTGAKLAEMVEAEASAAEAETPEDEDEEGADEEEDLQNRAVMEALGEYLGKVQGIFGEEQPVTPCRFCMGFGFNSLDILPDPHSHRCATCGGQGQVFTGSLVPGNESRPCQDCKGAGFQADQVLVSLGDTPAEQEPFKVLSMAEVERIAAEARLSAANATG